MIKLKLILSHLLLLILTLVSYPIYADDLPKTLIFFNDSPTSIDHQTLKEDEILYTPIRDLAALLSLDISYNDSHKEVVVSNNRDIFTYNLSTHLSTFNSAEILSEIQPLLLDNKTWVPILSFAKLFSFDIASNEHLMIEVYLGKEEVSLDYLPESLVVDLYDYIPVTSLFINEPTFLDHYTNGTFSVALNGIYTSNNKDFLSFIPFTEVNYPDGYTLISDPRLRRFSPVAFDLPLSPNITYTYLTYDPDAFSTATTNDFSKLWNDMGDGSIYLADITVVDGIITSIIQIYVP